ncbi:MAG TPA: SGNH/GDSL hydrolase family protein [Myxococcota bacterium]|nr:SGNH/GDSL hydrolase family protein [Myxococcota bacterium]
MRRFLHFALAVMLGALMQPACNESGALDGGDRDADIQEDGDGQGLTDADGYSADQGPADEAGDPQPADRPGDLPADAGADPGPAEFPIAELDDLKLYINIGDSLAAGYDASGENGSGGKGYARLMLENHPDYSSYTAHNLRFIYPDVQFLDVSHSGDTSSDALAHLKSTSLPDVSGDVLVSLTCGGNDFNDSIWTMISTNLTESAAALLQDNYREMAGLLRDKYEKPGLDYEVVFLVTNIHDPTAGTGAIPPEFTSGFCAKINDPQMALVRDQVVGNLNLFNQRIYEVIAELGGNLVDNHGVFFDHGMNAAGSERWITDDCVHPNNEGHNQLRREEWYVLTGDRF